MTTTAMKWSAALAVLLALGCKGLEGEQGKRGPAGPPGPAGPAGSSLPATNTVGGTVTDGQRPLAGVTVTTNPGHATATTDGAGAFSLPPLDVGVYDLSFGLAGFVDEVVTVAVPAGAPVKVSVTLAREGDGGACGPAVTVSFRGQVTLPGAGSMDPGDDVPGSQRSGDRRTRAHLQVDGGSSPA